MYYSDPGVWTPRGFDALPAVVCWLTGRHHASSEIANGGAAMSKRMRDVLIFAIFAVIIIVISLPS